MMNKNPKISILIPTYNSEQYIRRCLDSAIKQTFQDIEIVCLDDCSKDFTYDILKEYAAKDKRIRIYRNKVNKGIATNRNLLIKLSYGDYIFFLDSDDWIPKTTCKKFINSLQGKDYDMVVGKTKVTFSKCPLIAYNFFPTNNFNKKTSSIEYVEKNICLCWGSFIKRTYWNKLNISFNDKVSRIFEDLGIMPYVVLKTKKFKTVNACFYVYLRRKNSTSKFEGTEYTVLQQIIKQTDGLLDLFKKEGYLNNPKYQEAISGCLFAPLGYFIFFRHPRDPNNKRIFEKNKIELFNMFQKTGHPITAKNKSWWKKILIVSSKRFFKKNLKKEKINNF